MLLAAIKSIGGFVQSIHAVVIDGKQLFIHELQVNLDVLFVLIKEYVFIIHYIVFILISQLTRLAWLLIATAIKRWDYQNNTDKPWEIAPNAGGIRYWICKTNPNHRWQTSSNNRISKKSGCPYCCNGRSYSNAQIEWLQGLEKQYNIKIQHALSSEGEYVISGVGKVDGYCKEINTVYEYHGDFWHGNPKVYHPNDINPRTFVSYGELYRKTLERESKIRQSGYNLFVEWETPFESMNEFTLIIDPSYFNVLTV